MYEELWQYTIPFTESGDESTTVRASEVGGFMTGDQKDFITDKHKNLKVNNEIELTYELEIMLNEIVLEHFTNDDTFDDDDDDGLIEIIDVMKNSNYNRNVKRGLIPADFIFANTIPVPNLRLIRQNVNIDLGSEKRYGTNVYTVFMYDNEISRLKAIHDSEELREEPIRELTVVIGFVRRELIINGERIEVTGYPIITNIDADQPAIRVDRFHCMLPEHDVDYCMSMPMPERLSIINGITNVYVELSTILADYYAIQQLLLNPLIKKYSSTDRIVDKFRKGGGKNGGKKKPVKYIKRIKIDTEDTINLIYKKDENGNRTRKTLIWYVCGHWVNRKGKRYFRHGYWKGPLRDSNPELFVDGVRQREIV